MDNCTEEVEDLFKKMFRIDKEKRINFSEIRLHPVFTKYFPKASMESQILYGQKFKSSLQKKGKLTNKLKSKAEEIAKEREEKLSVPSVICIQDEEKEFSKEKLILSLEM